MKILNCLILVLLITSCGSFSSKLSKEKIRSTESIVSQKSFKKVKSLSKSKTYTKKLRKGQWVTVLTKMKDGSDITLTTTKVIKATKKLTVLENEVFTASSGKTSHSKIFLENYPLKHKLVYSKKEAELLMNKVNVVKIINKNPDGSITEMPVQVLALTGATAVKALSNNVNTGNISKSSCSTKYLKSKRCISYPMKMSIMGFTNNAKVTVHSGVPINGQIVMEDEYSTNTTISYGTRGAKSAF